MKSKSTVILYNGGSYGSYLHWLIYSMTFDGELFEPFTKKGTSHEFDRLIDDDHAHLIGSPTIEELLTMPNEQIPPLVKIHPKTQQSESLVENINLLLEKVEKLIIVYPDKDSYLLNINNYVYKIWDDLWSGALGHMRKQDLYDNFPVSPDTKLEDIPRWVVREYLSYNLFDAWEDQVEWYLPQQYQHPNCHYVFVNNLLYQPINTLDTIRQFADLSWVRDPQEILPFHEKNIVLQKYIEQDHIARTILTNLIDNDFCSWSADEITIITEAWIQRSLRDHGYNFKCHGLDQFPCNTIDLTTLLEKHESI